jgi:biopolymer transport protein ExbB
MKKVFSILAMAGVFVLSANTVSANANVIPSNMSSTLATMTVMLQDEAAAASEDRGFTQVLKEQFIQGGAGFMGIVLLCLILGLAVAIERIIYLNLASTNTNKLKKQVEDALASGGIEAAKEVCRNTKGPVASIYYQGLDRAGESIDSAEKAVVSYGGVQMGQLEKNVSWLSLFIAIAPMLGFMGTVIGMIQAFQKISAVGNLSASLIAGDIQVALLTTVFGLITAIILQIFYNYIIAKIDSIVNDMEDSSITLIDMLVDHKK